MSRPAFGSDLNESEWMLPWRGGRTNRNYISRDEVGLGVSRDGERRQLNVHIGADVMDMVWPDGVERVAVKVSDRTVMLRPDLRGYKILDKTENRRCLWFKLTIDRFKECHGAEVCEWDVKGDILIIKIPATW